MPKTELDPTSAEPVLFYTGPGIVGDVPADDLSANTLARILRGRGHSDKPADIAKLRDELAATGKYATEKP